MKPLSAITQATLMSLALLSLPSCEKEDEKPAIPYYQFTADDMQWLNFKQGDKWVFETASGKQQRYEIERIDKEIKHANATSVGMGISFAEPAVKFYSDAVRFELKRLDSLGYNTLEFARTLPTNASYDYPPAGAGEFKFGGMWQNYAGDLFAGSLPGNLNITSNQLQAPNISVMEVKGKTYSSVILLNAAGAVPPGPGFRYIRSIYYERSKGVIRMVSRSGEVWDRLP